MAGIAGGTRLNRPPPATERISPRFEALDGWDDASALAALWESQLAAVAAIGPALPALAAAVAAAAARIGQTGRLVYAGAGSSARIAAQDAAELAPTFAWPAARALVLIAGGPGALLTAAEGAEDRGDDGAAAVAAAGLGPADVLIGIAASGATAYTLGCVAAARAAGALSIGIANSPGAPLLAAADHAILLATAPEPIAGSTRLGAGTAQKVALNLFSTQLMVRLGRVYRGRMVEMRPTNAKLRRRAIGIVAALSGASADAAEAALAAADDSIKLAVLMARGRSRAAAEAALADSAGRLRPLLDPPAG